MTLTAARTQTSLDARESKALKEVLTDPSEHDRMAGRTHRAALRLLRSLLEVFCALVELLCALGSAVIVRLTIALVLREEGGAVFGSEAKALAVGKILSGGFFSPIFGYRLALLILGAQKPAHQKQRSGVFGRVLSIAYRDYREPPDVAVLFGQRPRTIRVCLSVCSRVQEGERRHVWMVSHYARHPQEEARFRPISRSEHPGARMALICYFAQSARFSGRCWTGKDEGGEVHYPPGRLYGSDRREAS